MYKALKLLTLFPYSKQIPQPMIIISLCLHIDGEYKLCIKLSDDLYKKIEGVKDIKTQLKFSNEYYKCKLSYVDYHISKHVSINIDHGELNH